MTRRIPPAPCATLCLVMLFPGFAAGGAQTRGAAGNRAEQPGSTLQVTLGQSAVPLYGPWKFTVGDSPIDARTGKPLWAEPGFDDSKWEAVDLTPKDGDTDPLSRLPNYVPGWTAKGHPGYFGYAWYRIRVSCQSVGGGTLALAGPDNLDDAYQVFANGTLVGSFGDFSGKQPEVYYAQPTEFRLPEGCRSTGSTEASPVQLLAFRFWMAPGTLLMQLDAGGMHSAPLLGEAGVIGLHYQSQWVELIRNSLLLPIEALVFALLAMVAFSLILFDRSDPAYHWIGLLFLLSAVSPAWMMAAYTTTWFPIWLDVVATGVFSALSYMLWTMVWWVWFGRAGFRWLPWWLWGLSLVFFVSRILAREIFPGLVSHSVALQLYSVNQGLRFVIFGVLAWIVIDGIRRKGFDGWLVLPVILLRGITMFGTDLYRLHLVSYWFLFGVQMALTDVVNFLIVVVIALLLLRRLLQSVKRQREMAMDVKQAQEVQQVILPEAHMALPGLAIESVYRPAREVGGDFFQIIPRPTDGSLLIVAGDVAGKGLQAGMLVALLVGAIRTAAQYDPDPYAVLKTLNQRLMGRGNAAATCLALRIAPDGQVTLANAGHLPPWLNGQEIAIEGALPLGLYEAAEPSLTQFHLGPDDKLVLISDGILEAADESGELFGFDRIQALLAQPTSATTLADAAQSFGQNDDISVITLTRMETATAGMVS